MILISYIFPTSLAVISGFSLLSLLMWPGIAARSPGEQFALSYLVGIMLIGVEMSLLDRFGIPVRQSTIAWLQLIPTLMYGLQCLSQKRVPLASLAGGVKNVFSGMKFSCSWWQWLLILLIVTKVIYIFGMNVSDLQRSDDSFTVLLSLAKHTYYHQGSAGFAVHQPHIPGFIMSWFGMGIGEWNEYNLNLTYFNFYVALLVLFYANLAVHIGKSGALIGVYVLSSFPLLLNHSVMTGYADMIMAIFVCFSCCYAYRYCVYGKKDDLILAVFFLFCLPAIKSEGKAPYFVFSFYALFIALALRRHWLKPGAIWLMTTTFLMGGLAAINVLAMKYPDTVPPFLAQTTWTRILWDKIRPVNHLIESIAPLKDQFGFVHNNWIVVGTLLPLVIISLTFFYRKKEELILVIYSLLLLVSFFYLFCFSESFKWLLNGTTVNRSYLQIVPVLLFTAIIMILKKNKQ